MVTTRTERPPISAFAGAACFPAIRVRPGVMLHDSRHRGESAEQWTARLAAARAVCGRCPAVLPCQQLREHYSGRREGADGILAGQPVNAPPYNRKKGR